MKKKTVFVQYATKVNPKNGRVEYVKCRGIHQDIAFDYGDGRVRTVTGDVWHVRDVRNMLIAIPRMERYSEPG